MLDSYMATITVRLKPILVITFHFPGVAGLFLPNSFKYLIYDFAKYTHEPSKPIHSPQADCSHTSYSLRPGIAHIEKQKVVSAAKDQATFHAILPLLLWLLNRSGSAPIHFWNPGTGSYPRICDWLCDNEMGSFISP